jgi:integrase
MLSQDTANTARPGTILRDATIPGLHLRAFAQSRGFYLSYRFRGQQRKPKLGDYPTLTITAARRIAKDMLERVACGEDPSAERQALRAAATVADMIDRYNEHHAPGKKTGNEDKRMARAYVRPKLGKLKVADVRVTDIMDLHAAMSKTPAQANRVLALLSKMFELAILWEMRPLNSNPCRHVVRYPARKRRRYATAEEAAKIVERLRHYEAEFPAQVAFTWLLIYTGARPSEIAAAMPEHLKDGRLVLTVHKTDGTGDERVIQLPPQALRSIEKLPKRKKGETLLGIKSSRHLWRKIIADTKIVGLWRYDLRHTFASLGLSSGMTLARVGELLGHRSTQTTSRYAHLIDDQAKQDATEIANSFDDFAKPKLRVA